MHTHQHNGGLNRGPQGSGIRITLPLTDEKMVEWSDHVRTLNIYERLRSRVRVQSTTLRQFKRIMQ